MAPIRAIILASSPGRAYALRRMLARRPFESAIAANSEEARALLLDDGPAVLVCDEQCDGFGWSDVLDLAWDLPYPAPVLVILPKFDAGTWLRVLRGGAGEIVCEPLTFEKFAGALRCAARLTPRRTDPVAVSPKTRFQTFCRTLLGLGSRPGSV
jgi:DNA-binding NarL/FixJ family response regulator